MILSWVKICLDLPKGEEAARQAAGWLENLTGKVRQHTAVMDAFNKKIQNGEAALQKWAGIAAAAFGTQALRRYLADAEEALRVSQQLAQTLQRLGAGSAAQKELNAQAAALERATLFTAAQVTQIQRLLVANRATIPQTIALTRATLDFAAATGMSAEAAGSLVARALSDDTAELARFNLALDLSKDRATALTEALSGYASGQAEAAVVDRRAHAAKVDLDNATKSLGASLLTLKGPLLETVMPFVTLAGGVLKGVVDLFGPLAPRIARTALALGAVALAIKGLGTGINLVKMVINPLRAGFVALTGNINDTFLATMRLNTAEWGGIKNLMKAMNTGMKVAVGASILGAAAIGYQIGAAIGDAIAAGMATRRQAIITATTEATQASLAIIKKAGAIRSQEQARDAAGELRAQIADMEKKEAALTALGKQTTRVQTPYGPGAAVERGLNPLEQTQLLTYQNTLLNLRRDLADLGDEQRRAATLAKNAAVDAQAAGQKRIAALVTRLPELRALHDQQRFSALAADAQIAELDQRLLALREKAAALPAGAKARLAAEDALAEREQQRAAAAAQLDARLNTLAAERAAIEASRFLADAEKHARLIPLLEQENRLIAERVALLQGDTSPEASRETRSLGDRAAANTAGITQAQPLTLAQELAAAAATATDQLGTDAQIAAAAWGQAADSIRTSMGSALSDMIWQTGFTREAFKNLGMSIAENFVQTGAQMVADWIFKHTIMAAWSSLFRTKEIAGHATAETAKTTATTAAETARTGIKATAEAAKTGIHLTSETAQTTATVTNAATRTTANTTEGMGWLAKAAIQAMNAVASIPYVGPILAVAAAAAIIAAGIKLLSGGFRKGGYTGDGPADEVAGPVHRGEYVIPAPAVAAIGLENIPSLLAEGITSPLPRAAAPAPARAAAAATSSGAQPINVSIWDNRRRAGQWLKRQSGRRLLEQTLRHTAWERGQRT